jgi:hypothetical protein
MKDFRYGRTVYRVDKVEDEVKINKPAYRLIGPRGAVYHLIPCRDQNGVQREEMFSFNLKNWTARTPFGSDRFVVEDDEIKTLLVIGRARG